LEKMTDLVAVWEVALSDGVHKIEFEHGTTSGKRVIYVDGKGEFVEDGTETHFTIGNHDCCIKAVSSGKRREGIIHSLIVDDNEIPESTD
ncbi:FAIM1 protein, partial [Polypterus senegalus]